MDEKENSQEERLARRQGEILQAALKVFSRKGFSGASTSEIAREAGVAEGTIFRYFPTKKDLLISLVAPGAIDSLDQLLRENWEEEPQVTLGKVFKNRAALLNDKRELFQLLFYESKFHPELREKFVEELVLKAIALMEDYFRYQVAQGRFRDLNPGVAVRALAGMLGFFILWREVLQGERYWSLGDDEVVSSVLDIFFHGVATPGDQPEGEGVSRDDS